MTSKSAIFILILAIISCKKDDPTGPETNCELNTFYKMDYHGVEAAKVFDLNHTPPLEIRNDHIEYGLYYQWTFEYFKTPIPFPYSMYFLDTVQIINPEFMEVHVFESDLFETYGFIRDDCALQTGAGSPPLSFQLTNHGT